MNHCLVFGMAESESSSRKRHRPLVALANGGGGDFELRHWRTQPSVKRTPSSLRRRWTPPEIEIPNGNGSDDDAHGYTSLRDILTSPEYVAVVGSPVAGGGGGSCGEIHIRNPLVKHAAYAYLQPTPSAMENSGRRRRRSPLCRLLLAGGELFGSCLGFVGALFQR